jgi:hypothetical protein
VRYFSSREPYDETFSEIRAWRPDVFHIQHETSIMPPEQTLERYAALMTREGIKVMVTLHTENDGTLRLAKASTLAIPKRVILHRPTPSATDAVVIPMPCTTLGVAGSREELRKKFGFPKDAFIISTVGFMIPWKDHPKIVETLAPWISEHEKIHLQVIASEHFNPVFSGYAQGCREQISRFAAKIPRILHIDGYPDDRELVERLVASDLGYVWCPFDTGSSSAAAAQFTTARCPLVATDSSHYAFLGSGIVRSPKGDLDAFVKSIKSTSINADLLKKLRENQWTMYLERNYLETARKHLDLYGGVS